MKFYRYFTTLLILIGIPANIFAELKSTNQNPLVAHLNIITFFKNASSCTYQNYTQKPNTVFMRILLLISTKYKINKVLNETRFPVKHKSQVKKDKNALYTQQTKDN